MTSPANPLIDIVSEAVSSVGAALPAQCTTMSVDGRSGEVAFTSAVDLGTPHANADGPAETRTLVASRGDFPSLSISSLVTLGDGSNYIITSLRLTGDAAWFVGLSAPLADVAAVATGTRRSAGLVVRSFNIPADILAAEGEIADTYSAAVAPNLAHGWYLVVQSDAWHESTPPQTGDTFRFYSRSVGHEVEVRVARVDCRHGHYLLTGRD